VIVDLHVVRVAPRLGIATGSDPKKIEKQSWMRFLNLNGTQVWQCHFLEGKFADRSPNAKYV
jgi:endonuclease III